MGQEPRLESHSSVVMAKEGKGKLGGKLLLGVGGVSTAGLTVQEDGGNLKKAEVLRVGKRRTGRGEGSSISVLEKKLR